ncbi:HPr family phosphocarrier protein [Streptomyces sp. NPDC093250]|uniref:HPr family phosphocarrier protein n=1 Tax=Streptomyces sp. NPDC093250 TaxID=3366036 RepID=UPI0038044E17
MSVTRTVTVLTPSGIHARPAAAFVTAAKRYNAEISLESAGRTGNCKSLMSVLKLGVVQGATVALTADGPDEADAIEALAALLGRADEDGQS